MRVDSRSHTTRIAQLREDSTPAHDMKNHMYSCQPCLWLLFVSGFCFNSTGRLGKENARLMCSMICSCPQSSDTDVRLHQQCVHCRDRMRAYPDLEVDEWGL